MSKKKIIIVLGQTGSGKSTLALKIAKKYNGYLISADSQQVYNGLKIGSNQDDGKWVKGKFIVGGVEEYLVDFLPLEKKYSAAQWVKDCKKIIKKNKDRLPIIVGGSGLYIDALIKGFDFPEEADEKIRLQLETEIENKGIEFIVNKMKKIDSKIESKIEITNPRRVVRAAEILFSTKKPLQLNSKKSDYEFLQFGIKIDREKLYSKIDKRMNEMIDEGLVDETQKVIDYAKGKILPSMGGIGYKQIRKYIDGEISIEEAIELNKRDTRRYAKRQMTWFKRDKSIKWVTNFVQADKSIKGYLK